MNDVSSRRPKANRDAIVVAARRVARERGWTAVTIRAIADELGYASPIIYEHFRTKDEVVAAVARLGFDDLCSALKDVEAPRGTDDRIVVLGAVYVDFARRHPELYRAMHAMDGAATAGPEVAAGAHEVCDLASGEIQEWAHAAGIQLSDPFEATEILWCLLHGIASLTLAGRREGETGSQVRSAVHVLLAGWRASGS